ncbi:hypothetical protein GYA93_22515 [Gordonia desulfuricans]|uniref:Uncharacterized protein n=1 Tax=Gordonia desulfuricans TaxID=89051 RepID=A0A7K3LVR2_9ACTN|nr:hypothetical protein [Gordonia desulfuricans]NDK92309.1 hypothetical protein [Gordonia desulfuricans]
MSKPSPDADRLAALVARIILAAQDGDRENLARITDEAERAGLGGRLAGVLATVLADHLPAERVVAMASAHLDALAGEAGR